MTNVGQDRRIDYIEFSVTSVPDTKKFYGSAFGWSRRPPGDHLRGRSRGYIFSFPGGRRFHFTDPSGHELAVWSDK